jgi:hypothetical protein
MAQTGGPPTFITKHTGTFNGQRVSYTATVGKTVIADDKSTSTASFRS